MKPIRMCIVCKKMKDRDELFRVAKNSEGIFVDTINKIQGRGAYICPDKSCFQKARKAKRLERALEAQIPENVYDLMAEELK